MGLVNPSAKFEDEDDNSASIPAVTTAQTSSRNQAPKGTNMTQSAPTTKVVTGVIRGSYCNLFKAVLPKTAKEGDVPKYGMTLLIPKEDTATIKKIKAAQEAAIAVKWPKRPAKVDFTLHDGDEPRPSNGEAFGDECKGHYVMTCNSKFKPKIIDRDNNEVLDGGEVGSGDYFKVSINAYPYDSNGKRGVAFGLNNVLFWAKGDSLGGAGRAEDDFRDDLNS